MAAYATLQDLKNHINQQIYSNNAELITGVVMQETLHDMLDTLESLGHALEETDPTVASYIKNITQDEIDSWNSMVAGGVTDLANHNIGELGDVSVEAFSSGHILQHDGSNLINRTLAEAGIAAADHTHSQLHNHSNKSVLDGIASGDVNNWNSAYSKSHSHANKSFLDTIDQNLATTDSPSFVSPNITGAFFQVNQGQSGRDAGMKIHTGSGSYQKIFWDYSDGRWVLDDNVHIAGALSAEREISAYSDTETIDLWDNMPVATATSLGGVKVDGSVIFLSGDNLDVLALRAAKNQFGGLMIDETSTPFYLDGNNALRVDGDLSQFSSHGIGELSNVAISGLSTGNLIVWNGSNFANVAKSGISVGDFKDDGTYLTAETDTLDDVVGRGATTSKDITTGAITAQGSVIVQGDLTVEGTQFITNTETVEITDNVLVINNGETSDGVSAGFGGIDVDRGPNWTAYRFAFEESTDLFKIGEVGNLQAVATRPDTVTNDYIARWDGANNRLKFVSQLTWGDVDTTNTLNVAGLQVQANYAYLNYGSAARDSGVKIDLGDGTYATLKWDSNNSRWILDADVHITGALTASGEIAAYSDAATASIWDDMPVATANSIGGIKVDGSTSLAYLDADNILQVDLPADAGQWDNVSGGIRYTGGNIEVPNGYIYEGGSRVYSPGNKPSKSDVGLGNVRNIVLSTAGWSDMGISTTDVSKADVGLGNVPNTNIAYSSTIGLDDLDSHTTSSNITVNDITFGSDNWGKLTNESEYGAFTSTANNDVVIHNLQGINNQYLFLGDSGYNHNDTIFGVGNDNYGTHYKILDLKGTGDLFLSGGFYEDLGSTRVYSPNNKPTLNDLGDYNATHDGHIEFNYNVDGGNRDFLRLNNNYDRDIGITFQNQGTNKWTIWNDGAESPNNILRITDDANTDKISVYQGGDIVFDGTIKAFHKWDSDNLDGNSFYVSDGTDGFAFGVGGAVSTWFAYDSDNGVNRMIDVWNDGSQIVLRNNTIIEGDVTLDGKQIDFNDNSNDKGSAISSLGLLNVSVINSNNGDDPINISQSVDITESNGSYALKAFGNLHMNGNTIINPQEISITDTYAKLSFEDSGGSSSFVIRDDYNGNDRFRFNQDGNFKIIGGDSGESGGWDSNSIVRIKNDSNTYIEFETPSSKYQGIYFTDNTPQAGGIEYGHNGTSDTNTLMLGAWTDISFRINSTAGVHQKTEVGHIDTNGNLDMHGEIAAYSSSDQLLKKNIQNFSATDIINGLNPKVFQWNDTAKDLNKNKDDRLNYGLIAQEVEKVLPEMVHNLYGGKYLGLDYEQLIPVLLQGMKEQQEKIEKLEKQQTPKNQ